MRCKTCGQLLPQKGLNAHELVCLLKAGAPHREVYRAQGGGWFVSYGGGAVSPEVVHELISSGEIHPVYSNCPNDAFHVGRTLDVERTLEARRELGKHAPRYYVEDSP